MKITSLILVLLLSITVHAKKPKKSKRPQPRKPVVTQTADFVKEERMQSINLQGLQILADGFNEFKYQAVPVTHLDAESNAAIANYSRNRVVSRIYRADQNLYHNILLYVAKVDPAERNVFTPEANYVLHIVQINRPGSSFVTRYYITRGDANALTALGYKKDYPKTIKNPNGLYSN